MAVLVVGSIGLDDVKTQKEAHRNLLGGSASFAAVAASFFTSVKLVGVVGTDFPEEHKAFFASRGIDLAGLEIVDGKTFRWSGEYEEDMNNRQTLSIALNVFEHFSPKLPAGYQDTDYVLLANIAPALQSRVLDQVKQPKFVVADTMDLWIDIAQADLLALIKRVDMLILNDSEAKKLAKETNVIKAGRRLLEQGPRYITIKKGEHGAILFSKDEGIFAIPAFPLAEVFDPTGAGDTFAGSLLGYCAKHGRTDFSALKEALIQATLVASFNVESFSMKRLEKLQETEWQARLKEYRAIATLP